MLSVSDCPRYERHRATREDQSRRGAAYQELILPALSFGSIGAIAWAIRGTNGWGGIDGTIVPGMMWGILWFYACWRRGIACHGVPLWLGLGIALGGELGYGQYVSWIRGMFNVGDEVIHINPAYGWLWFLLAGIGWGAPGGVLLGWALSRTSSLPVWIGRLTIPAATAACGWLLVQWFPAVFFPNHDLGIYAAELDRHLDRTVYTNTQNFTVVAWWLGAVLTALLQRDKASFISMSVIGGGFGIGFATAAAWCLGYEYAPKYIDWWKVWELNAGFNLGVLYVLALYWNVRRMDRTHNRDGKPLIAIESSPNRQLWAVRTLFETLAVFLIVLTIYGERDVLTSAFMGLIYAGFMGWVAIKVLRGIDVESASRLRGRISLCFCVFLFLFVTLRGATSTLGLVLELYDAESVDQYAWPMARKLLFLPMAGLVVAGTLYQMVRTIRDAGREHSESDPRHVANRIVTLMTGLAVVGAVSIWPSKIAILYSIFLCIAVWSFIRLHHHFDAIDST